MKQILDFLKSLERNNNREWFDAHRKEFVLAQKVFEEFIGEVITGLGKMDDGIRGLSPKQVIFRIYRDTRFSTDKTPYKTNFGAHISRGGRKSGEPGYYFHLQPGEGFLSGGMYMPEPEKLKAIRKEIFLFPEDYKAVTEAPGFRDSFTLFTEDRLKRPPAGFPADFELIEVLKNKHFCPWFAYDDAFLEEPDLVERVVGVYSRMKPFNDFLNRALESLG